MKHSLILTLLAMAQIPTQAVAGIQADPMCASLRSFVDSVKPNETGELTFHTLWGSNFKGETEPAIYAKRCIRNGYESAKAICSFLMEQGAIEFSGNNVKRALSCLSPETNFGPLVDLNRGLFSLHRGTPSRGSIVTVEFGEDYQLGGMAFRISAHGY